MKKVHIQDLKRIKVDHEESNRDTVEILVNNNREKGSPNFFDKTEQYNENKIYAKYVSGSSVDEHCPNYFIGTYLHAYNNHQDVIFSVNDVWSIITQQVSKYINI
jgi:hypothetical protein